MCIFAKWFATFNLMHFLQLESLVVILGATLRFCREFTHRQQDGTSSVKTVWIIFVEQS